MRNNLAYWRNFFLGLGGLLIMQGNGAMAGEPSRVSQTGVVGWIGVEPGGEGERQILALSGWALAMAPISGNYTLTVRRQGKGGASNTSQSGRFTAGTDGPVRLSQTSVNLTPSDVIEIDLRISVDGREMFHASMKPAGAAPR